MEDQKVFTLHSKDIPVGVFSEIKKLLEYCRENEKTIHRPIGVTVDVVDKPMWPAETFVPISDLLTEEELALLREHGFSDATVAFILF